MFMLPRYASCQSASAALNKQPLLPSPLRTQATHMSAPLLHADYSRLCYHTDEVTRYILTLYAATLVNLAHLPCQFFMTLCQHNRVDAVYLHLLNLYISLCSELSLLLLLAVLP